MIVSPLRAASTSTSSPEKRAFAMPGRESASVDATCGFFESGSETGEVVDESRPEVCRFNPVGFSCAVPGGASFLALGLGAEDVGCVMEDHAPARPRALEHVGHAPGAR